MKGDSVMRLQSKWPRRVAFLVPIVVIVGLLAWLVFSVLSNDKSGQDNPVVQAYEDRLPGLKKQVDSKPDDAALRTNYAVALYATGDLKAARAQYEKSVELDDTNATTYNNLGNVYRDLGQTKQAITAYDQAITHNNKLVNPYFNLANIQQYTLDKPEDAVATYQRALKALPENEQVMLSLGLAYEAVNDTARAEQMYRAILAKNPDNSAATANLERLTKTSKPQAG